MPDTNLTEHFRPETPGKADVLHFSGWSKRELIVFASGVDWAASLRAELAGRIHDCSGHAFHQEQIHFVVSWYDSARDTLEALKTRNVHGLIAVLDGMEQSTLVLLSRLMGLNTVELRILVAGSDHHRNLTPVLFESGVSKTMFNNPTDIQIADWCQRISRT